MLVCEDPTVYELLHLRQVAAESSEGIAGCIFSVSEHTQKEVIRGYSKAAGSNRFFARIVDYRIEFVRYAYFHNVFYD